MLLRLAYRPRVRRCDRRAESRGRAALLEETRKRGLLVGKGGPYGNVIRPAPPMTVTEDETEEALGILTESIKVVAA